MNEEDRDQQKAQSHCTIFGQWGAKKTDRTYKKSLLQKKPLLSKNLGGDIIVRIQAGSLEKSELNKRQNMNIDKIFLHFSAYQDFNLKNKIGDSSIK